MLKLISKPLKSFNLKFLWKTWTVFWTWWQTSVIIIRQPPAGRIAAGRPRHSDTELVEETVFGSRVEIYFTLKRPPGSGSRTDRVRAGLQLVLGGDVMSRELRPDDERQNDFILLFLLFTPSSRSLMFNLFSFFLFQKSDLTLNLNYN